MRLFSTNSIDILIGMAIAIAELLRREIDDDLERLTSISNTTCPSTSRKSRDGWSLLSVCQTYPLDFQIRDRVTASVHD